jgi:hypothetical protein
MADHSLSGIARASALVDLIRQRKQGKLCFGFRFLCRFPRFSVLRISSHIPRLEIAAELFDDSVNVGVEALDQGYDLRSKFRHNFADPFTCLEKVLALNGVGPNAANLTDIAVLSDTCLDGVGPDQVLRFIE